MDVGLLEDVAEWQKLLQLAERPSVRAAITTKVAELQRQISANSGQPERSPLQSDDLAIHPLMDFAWDQDSSTVKIYLELPGKLEKIPQECLHPRFTENSLELKVTGLVGRPSYRFFIDKLFASIDPRSCSAKAKKGNNIHITLKKAVVSHWTDLKKKVAPKLASSKAEEFPENEPPTASLIKLMQRLYEEGDDDMKRTICQSWTQATNKGVPDLPM